jgi:signal transduction histidine kinase
MDAPEPTVSADSLQRQRAEIQRGLRRVNLAAVVIFSVLVGLVGLGVAAARRAERSAREARIATLQGQEELWKSYLAQARAERLTGLPGRSDRALKAITAAANIRPSLELRDEAIAALSVVDLQSEAVFWPYPTNHTGHCFDPTINRLAWHDAQGVTHVHRMDDHREIARLAGPNVPLRVRQFSPDGRLLAIAHAKGEIVVWDLEKQTRAFSARYDDRYDRGPGLAFTADGRELAIGDTGASRIRFLNSTTGTEVRSVAGSFPEQIFLHPDQPLVASFTGGTREVRVRNWESGTISATYTNATPIMNAAWAARAGMLAVADGSGEITIWNQITGEKRTFAGHIALVSRLAFSPDGSLLVSGSWDGFSRLWNPHSGRQVLALQGGFAEGFSADGTRLAFEREGAGVGYWPVRRGEIFRELKCDAGQRKAVFSVSFSPDGRYLAAAGGDGVCLLDPVSGADAGMLPIPGNLWAQTAEFQADGANLVASGRNGLYLWRADVLTNRFRADLARFIPVPGEPTTVKLSSEGKLVMTTFNADVVRVINLEETEKVVEIRYPGFNSVAISHDGKWVATGSAHGDGHWVWDAATGKPVKHLDGVNGPVDFSPDGRWLVTGSAKEFVVWETGSWTRARAIERGAANDRSAHCAFAPDGALFAGVHSQGLIHLIDPRDGVRVAALTPPDSLGINDLAFSGDGKYLATASSPNTVQLWNIHALRQQLQTLGLDWGQEVIPTPAGNIAPAEREGFGTSAVVTFCVGGLALLFAGIVFHRHRRLIHANAEVETRFEQRGQELEVARSEIMHSQKMKALGTMAAGIAHDFNNLLSVIRMSNDLNGEAKTKEEILANVAEIDSAVQQGKSVVRSMLGYTRASKNEGPYSVAEAVQGCLGLLSRQFLSGVHLKLELDESVPKVSVDRGRLEQVLLNLVVNAAEAMKGAGELNVTVRRADPDGKWNVLRPAAALADCLELVVADSGPGIEPALLPRIFEPFLTTKNSGAARGTGLGLSIVYTIASKDGLGIAVESTPGHGAEFRIAISTAGAERTVESTGSNPKL